MKSILKNYIGHVESPNSHGTVSYLEPVIEGLGEKYATMSLKAYTTFIETSIRRVSSISDKETMQDIQALHGVDPSSMLKSVLENEMENGNRERNFDEDEVRSRQKLERRMDQISDTCQQMVWI